MEEAVAAAGADYQELTKRLREKEEAETALAELMDRWEEAAQVLEG